MLLEDLGKVGKDDGKEETHLVRETLAEPSPQWSDINEEGLDLSERNIKQCKRKICDGHYTAAVRVISSLGVAPYSDATLEDLKAKHPFKPSPFLPHISIDHHHLIASLTVVLDRIKSFPYVSFLYHPSGESLSGWELSKILGEYITSAPLTQLVKPGGGICPIAVDGYLDDLQFGVGVSGGGEAILHVVNRLIEGHGDDVGLLMFLVDIKNALNLVDREVMLKEAWYLDNGTIIGDTLVVGKVLELIMKDGPRYGLHLNVDKTEVFWPKEDPRSSSELVIKRVAKTIVLMDIISKINDP
ncbi:hypothetical protein Tco_0523092 [Tanacetum coccineum]